MAAVTADRGMASAANARALAHQHIYHAMCPQAPDELRARLAEPRFLQRQQRRAQTEGRMGLFKNVFLQGQLRSKGYAQRHRAIWWAVLAHNLWVLARLAIEAAAQRKAA